MKSSQYVLRLAVIVALCLSSLSLSAAKEAPVRLTAEQLARYKAGLSDPHVVAIRRFLDYCQKDAEKGTVEGDCALLEPFAEDELSGRFIVYWVQNHIGGGRQIAILFQQHPHRIINTWVYAPRNRAVFKINEFKPAGLDAKKMAQIRSMLGELITNPEMGV